MKKKYLLLSCIILVSCNEKRINFSNENHLKQFHLNGRVKQLTIEITENEITDNSYIPKKKGINPVASNLVDKINIPLGIPIVDISSSIKINNIYGSQSLHKNQITPQSGSIITNYEILFNKNGYITKIIELENFKEKSIKKWVYDNQNRVLNFEWSNVNFGDDGNLKTTKHSYKYNNDGLIISSIFEWNGEKSHDKFNYSYEENYIKANKTKDDEEFILYLDESDKIKKIESETYKISLENSKIKRITSFKDNGEIKEDYNYVYQNNNLIKLEETERFNSKSPNFASFEFTYNNQGFVNRINSSTDKLSKDINFKYVFDNKNNWTNLKFQLDKQYYENAKTKVKRIEARAKYLSGNDKIKFLLNDKELFDARYQLEITKNYSSQTEVKRNIEYYE